MIRSMGFVVLAVSCFAGCQPQKTPEQLQAEQAAVALQQMGAAFGAIAGADGQNVDPAQMAAAMAQAGAIASAVNPDMSAEDRARLQAVTGAMASGQTHPAASAWLAGANKAVAVLKSVKDVPSANAAKVQLAPIYAEMTGPAATLKAMPEDQLQVAMGGSWPQFLSMGMNMAGLMMPLASNPEVSKLVEDMIEDMPAPS